MFKEKWSMAYRFAFRAIAFWLGWNRQSAKHAKVAGKPSMLSGGRRHFPLKCLGAWASQKQKNLIAPTAPKRACHACAFGVMALWRLSSCSSIANVANFARGQASSTDSPRGSTELAEVRHVKPTHPLRMQLPWKQTAGREGQAKNGNEVRIYRMQRISKTPVHPVNPDFFVP
jgi:hypothetical protein